MSAPLLPTDTRDLHTETDQLAHPYHHLDRRTSSSSIISSSSSSSSCLFSPTSCPTPLLSFTSSTSPYLTPSSPTTCLFTNVIESEFVATDMCSETSSACSVPSGSPGSNWVMSGVAKGLKESGTGEPVEMETRDAWGNMVEGGSIMEYLV
ncbi:hypothetical protein BC829DRAFT_409948 [Chytridium lagenaria]|nr:hypothetical protein BC829DRAFT_409948 [Chytridium lagenaria]